MLAAGFECNNTGRAFSPAAPHPNKKWGLHPTSTHQWNPCVRYFKLAQRSRSHSLPQGDSWVFEEQPFPIFALDVPDSNFFLKKALENKQRGYNWPKWAAELNSFMWASQNSQTCLRRGHCDPIGTRRTASSP